MDESRRYVRQNWESTHELVVLRSSSESGHKNTASPVEENYTELKTIRSPTNNYEQVLLTQESTEDENIENRIEEGAVTLSVKSVAGEKKENVGKKLIACIIITVAFITFLFAVVLTAAVLGLLCAEATADKLQWLQQKSLQMAEQVNTLKRELNISVAQWEAALNQQAADIYRRINDSALIA